MIRTSTMLCRRFRACGSLLNVSRSCRRSCSSKFYPCRLNINGDPVLWEKLGFHVENNVIALGEMSVHLYDKPTPFRLVSFFNLDSEEVTGVHDIPVIVNKVDNTEVADHPNGVYGVDHIVFVSPDASAAEGAFAEMGIMKKKQVQQGENTLSFYRPRNVTIEVITPPKGTSETDESTLTVVGITFVCRDLENLRKRYSEFIMPPWKAVQPHRYITSLHVDKRPMISLPIAFLSPHVKTAEK